MWSIAPFVTNTTKLDFLSNKNLEFSLLGCASGKDSSSHESIIPVASSKVRNLCSIFSDLLLILGYVWRFVFSFINKDSKEVKRKP